LFSQIWMILWINCCFIISFCGSRPGFQVLTGSAGSISILKKIQNDVVLVKTKVNGLQPGFSGSTGSPGQPAGSIGSHRVMTFSILSSTRPGSNPGSAGSRIDPSSRAGIQNYNSNHIYIYIYIYIYIWKCLVN